MHVCFRVNTVSKIGFFFCRCHFDCCISIDFPSRGLSSPHSDCRCYLRSVQFFALCIIWCLYYPCLSLIYSLSRGSCFCSVYCEQKSQFVCVCAIWTSENRKHFQHKCTVDCFMMLADTHSYIHTHINHSNPNESQILWPITFSPPFSSLAPLPVTEIIISCLALSAQGSLSSCGG